MSTLSHSALLTRTHGGPDADGAVAHDFSVNTNACGPCPIALEALAQADSTRYPDPGYTALRQQLAEWHAVAAERIVIAASASEYIMRMTAWSARRGAKQVHVPVHAYGDYAHAAHGWNLPVHACAAEPETASAGDLFWFCDPSSPLGQQATIPASLPQQATVVLDCAYAPLRLEGALAVSPLQRDALWQMWTPNKALGLTGIRAAYAIAPLHAGDAVAELDALAPSWPLGAHGVALLSAWTQASTQEWLTQSLARLRQWKNRLVSALSDQGWHCQPSATHFFCAYPPQPLHAHAVSVLRAAGIRLRDCSSFGLPGWWRIAALPPASQDTLLHTLESIHA